MCKAATVHFKADAGVLHSCLKSCHKICSPGRGCINVCFQCPHGKHLLLLNPAMEEAMQLALSIQPNFQDMSCLTTAKHLPHCALEVHHAETTTSASRGTSSGSSSRTVPRKSVYYWAVSLSAVRGPSRWPHWFQPKCDAEADSIPTFRDSMRSIPCPKVNVTDIEHTHTQNMFCLSTEYYMKRVLL
jgi:hypothetical protein